MGKTDLTLYVVTHKLLTGFDLKDREIIQVGNSSEDFGYIRDNTLSNISNKNKYFCELTALYWIWKNGSYSFVSLEHYRRFFLSKRFSLFKYNILSKDEAKRLMNKYDFIVMEPYRIKKEKNLWDEYAVNHIETDLICTKEIIDKISPEYSKDFDFVLYKTKSASFFNMFIANKKALNLYCGWLFPILFEVEKNINISTRDDYQARAFGFLAERLMNVWVYHNKNILNIGYLDVCNKDKSPFIHEVKRLFRKLLRT